MKSFISPIANKEQRHVALTTIASLGHRDLAMQLAMLFPEDGQATAISILSLDGAGESNRRELKSYIQKSLEFIEMDYRIVDKQVKRLHDLFKSIPNGKESAFLYNLVRDNPNLRQFVSGMDVAAIANIENSSNPVITTLARERSRVGAQFRQGPQTREPRGLGQEDRPRFPRVQRPL